MISSTIILGIICIVTETKLWGFGTNTWIALGILGFVPQVLGWLAINQALGHIKPTIASVSLLSQTVFTAFFSVMILNEVLTVHEIAGAVVVLFGIYLVNKKTNR
jgi:drug/metabolite transporter (DMT)-like permease